MSTTVESTIRTRREAIVQAHVAAENGGDIEGTIATFHAPRYEVNGEISDGADAVRDLLAMLLGASSDFRAEPRELHHTETAVISEGDVTGTHDGDLMGIAATGRRFRYPCTAIFEFDEDRLLCEKVYFDFATVLGQLGVLPDRDPAPGTDAAAPEPTSLPDGGPISAAAKRTLEAVHDADNHHDAAALSRCWTETGVIREVAGNGVQAGREQIEAEARARYRGFPDFRVEPVRLYESGHVAWEEVRGVGTHQGEVRGIPATGRSMELALLSKFRFAPDGLIEEEVVYYDAAKLLAQLGLGEDPSPH